MQGTLSTLRFVIRRIVCRILFALIIAIRIIESEKRFIFYSSQSFLVKSIYIHSFPLKFANLAARVFRFVVFSGTLEFEEKGPRRV